MQRDPLEEALEGFDGKLADEDVLARVLEKLVDGEGAARLTFRRKQLRGEKDEEPAPQQEPQCEACAADACDNPEHMSDEDRAALAELDVMEE